MLHKTVKGMVVQGHQVASGAAASSPYPGGTIALQMPFFKELGLDLSHYYVGTINISLAPAQVTLLEPDYHFEHLEWTSVVPPESFSFVQCLLMYNRQEYAAMIYYPHPETKVVHFQNSSIVEVIAPFIDNISYGDEVLLKYSEKQLLIN